MRLIVLVAVLSVVATLFVRDRILRAPSREEALAMEFFKLYHGRGIHRTTYWAGIPIQQVPTDMWMIQQIITEIKPDFLIETGTLKGGSSLYYASVLQGLDTAAKVITVDIADQLDRAPDFPVFRSRVILMIGDSVAPDTIRKIEDLVKGRPALVLLDSDHRKDHVLRELKLYARFVPDRSREKFLLTMCPKGYLKRAK